MVAVAEGALSVTDHAELEHARALVKGRPLMQGDGQAGRRCLEACIAPTLFTWPEQLESLDLAKAFHVQAVVRLSGSGSSSRCLGVAGANAIAEGHYGVMVADRGQAFELVPLGCADAPSSFQPIRILFRGRWGLRAHSLRRASSLSGPGAAPEPRRPSAPRRPGRPRDDVGAPPDGPWRRRGARRAIHQCQNTDSPASLTRRTRLMLRLSDKVVAGLDPRVRQCAVDHCQVAPVFDETTGNRPIRMDPRTVLVPLVRDKPRLPA